MAQTPSRWLRPWFYDGTSDRRVSSRPATGTSSLASPPQPERYFQARRAATGRPPADNASGAWPLIPSSLVTEGNRGPGLSRAPQWPGLTEAARARGGGVGCSPRVWHWRAPSRAIIQSLAMELAGAWQYRTGHESPPAAGRSRVGFAFKGALGTSESVPACALPAIQLRATVPLSWRGTSLGATAHRETHWRIHPGLWPPIRTAPLRDNHRSETLTPLPTRAGYRQRCSQTAVRESRSNMASQERDILRLFAIFRLCVGVGHFPSHPAQPNRPEPEPSA